MSRINHRNEAQILRAESDHIARCFILSFMAAWLFGILMAVVSVRNTPLPWVLLVIMMACVFLASWTMTVRKLDKVTEALLTNDCDCAKSNKSAPPTPPEQMEFVKVLDRDGTYKYIPKSRVGGYKT